MSEQDLYQAIVTDYEKTQSIKQTAENLKTNTIKVRRVLITEGLWSSKTSIAVGELHAKGYSTSEIAKELFISEKNVQSYLPYTKGAYGGGSKNDDAERAIGAVFAVQLYHRLSAYVCHDRAHRIGHLRIFRDHAADAQ